MRIPSGVTDQYIYFVAVDATDLKTRETGITVGNFSCYRSRNNGTATAYTTPTFAEVDATNMPGVYSLLLDEDMTIGAGNDSEEVCLHIKDSGGLMAPVTRVFELYRSKITAGNTLDVTSTGAAGIDWGNIENKTTANDLSGTDIQLADTTTTVTNDVGITATSVDNIWDEALTSGSHDVANSAGRRLRHLQEAGPYAGGAVWVDTVNGTSGTTSYENGTVNNPVDTIASAKTIADAVGLDSFHIIANSSFTLATSFDNYTFTGHKYTVALNGQSVSGATFERATITGNDDGTNTSSTVYRGCKMGSNTLGAHKLEECGLSGTITLAEAATYDWVYCYSRVSGTGTPGVDFGVAVANTNLNLRHYSGGIDVQNIGDSGTDNMSLEGNGQLVINANSSGGTIAVRGNFTVTDNAGGAVTLSDDARIDITQINDQVVDVIDTDTHGEPGQGAPGATISRGDKIDYMYKAWRNKAEQTNTEYKLYNDAGTTVDQKSTVSDDGSTATIGEKITGA